jgi:predicted alpha/beta hydrolase family esterase
VSRSKKTEKLAFFGRIAIVAMAIYLNGQSSKKEIMNGKNLIKIAVALLLTLWGSQAHLKAQLIPPDPYYELDSWSFDDTNWLSDLGFAPVSFANLNNPPSFDGNCLQVDSTNAAWLQYNLVESDGTNEIDFEFGTVELWVLPDWNSGTGPGDWGRLIDVGAYSTNTPSSWWSLYFTPDGSSVNFSSETNGVFTNYLSVPIAWDTNTWHFLALTYDHAHSQLYVDGQLATNGAGVFYRPSAEVISNGFFVGSDWTGWAQARAQIDDLATYNYARDAYDITNDYAAGLQLISPSGFRPTDGDPISPGVGGSGTNYDEFTNSFVPIDYGTNLWLAMAGDSNNALSLLLTNAPADILLEIEGCTNLSDGIWFSEGFVDGSELTNCVPFTAFTSKQGNLFLRIRSWADDTGTGIPDWWWLEYFGNITNVNANAEDPAGDGYDDLQKFQMGLNPALYYNTNLPSGFFGALDASGTNAFLEWSPAPGPVLNYAIQRGIQGTNGNYVYTQISLVSSNATFFEDSGSISNANAQNNLYTLTAIYPGGGQSGTDTWKVSWYVYYGGEGSPSGPPVPGNVYAYPDVTGTNVLLSWTLASSEATNYAIIRGIYNLTNYTYTYSTIAQPGSTATNYEVVGAMTNTDNWSDAYEVAAVYPGGVRSYPVSTYSDTFPSSIGLGSGNGPAAPGDFYGYVDGTGTNIILNWSPAPGAVTNYLVWGGYYDDGQDAYVYVLLGKVGAAMNSFTVAGAVDDSGNNLYDLYGVAALYPGGSLSQGAAWYSSSGPPTPATLNAYVDATGTNVALVWSPVPGATGYVVQRCDNYTTYGDVYFYPIGQVNAPTNSFLDTNEVNLAPYGLGPVAYEVQATFPDGGLSAAVMAFIATNLPAPTSLSATVDSTGTNVLLVWSPAGGNASGYVIKQGTYNPTNGTYSYTQIATVSASTNTFEQTGGVSGVNGNNNVYEVLSEYAGGELSAPDSSTLSDPDAPLTDNNVTLTAQMVRNQTGHWQLMFSGITTNLQAVVFTWYDWYYWAEFGPLPNNSPEINIPASELTNGIYVIPDYLTTNWIPDNLFGKVAMVQALGVNGERGNWIQAGFQAYDAPCFVDGRQPLKQNLLYQLRAATISQPNASLSENGVYDSGGYLAGGFGSLAIPVGTNCVESSLFHWSQMFLGTGPGDGFQPTYVKMDDLWPFTVNYELIGNLYDLDYTGPSAFVWQTNLVTVPAPAVLGIGDPYWISQSVGDLADVAAYTNSGNFYLQNSEHNLFGLPFEAALVNEEVYTYWDGGPFPVTGYRTPLTIAPGGSLIATNVSCFFSQTADPGLWLTNYYFAPVNTPGTALADFYSPNEPYPLPCLPGFANTNQTGVMITSVGTPTVIGGWARFSLTNGSSSKFAYLGQYYVTNAFVMTNGLITTNTTGVVSPYGDLFPVEPGQVAMVTMPDIDTGQQGTGVVDVIALNVDANHDGTMDFTFQGPDFVSSSKPFRFWANDDQDSGDDGGNGGIPGLTAAQQADGTTPIQFQNTGVSYLGFQSIWAIHGRRDLVDFFPVYLNIGSLFQSNALSAGISLEDTNWQFVLSQADGALRFAYTALTPTNYMNFLRDTNVSGSLAYAPLTTITATGTALTNAFLNGIATNNQGIILVEGVTATTQPLVLTIYHGTNQIAQTQLYLSISGVEQMFRSKTMVLTPQPGTVPDRLTDASVTNEPDTTEVNFIFVHGYNVNSDQARGWNADMYKRLYWSGSHAKYYGVTWEAADSQVAGVSIDLQTNIVNAFNTAPLLNTFLNSLPGPNVVVAHSLGNMLVLSTLNDYGNQNINTFFMIDAAVAIEAIDTSAPLNPDMYPSAWTNYESRLWASEWHNLWPATDARSTLTWSGRLAGLQNASIYNFFSSGEEVLRDYPYDPPTSYAGIVADQAVYAAQGETGDYTWAFQEKLKGLLVENFLLSSDHGGWQFNHSYGATVDNIWFPPSPSEAAALTSINLQTNAFFNLSSVAGSPAPFTSDLALESSSGSSYAQINRNRILSDAISCLTLPVGANPVPSFDDDHDFDMQTLYENGWPLVRGAPQFPAETTAFGEWHHSDVRAVAYTFTYKLFNQMVTVGNLK